MATLSGRASTSILSDHWQAAHDRSARYLRLQ